nr:hypothetical protein [Streptomyces sp. SID5476]
MAAEPATLWRVRRLTVCIEGATQTVENLYLRNTSDGSLSRAHRPSADDHAPVVRHDQPVHPAVEQRREIPWRGEKRSEGRHQAARMRAQRLPDLIEALNARDMALRGDGYWVDEFSRNLLHKRGARWRHAVSTALLGDWVNPLAEGHLPREVIGSLKTEAERIHLQEVPLWRRGTRKGRVLSLDAPLGDGLCLYDLLDSRDDLHELATRGMISDARLLSLLKALTEDEAAVLLARAEESRITWTEAASAAGATDPVALGERVRRKVARLADMQQKRHEASGGQWLPLPGRGGRS